MVDRVFRKRNKYKMAATFFGNGAKRIPAHCDMAGNEHADFLAKKGALVIQRSTKISTFNCIRLFSNMAFKYSFKIEATEMSKDKNWTILNENPSWVPEAPVKAAVAHFRLLTEHGCLRSHLHRVGIADSTDCTLCNSAKNGELLVVCPTLVSLNSIVEKYWRARALMV
ncbi:RNase H domain-containing protein [Trichonephila clavipes]|nr:RNase H domain-containing protein [Trichonephila clavipes]